LKWARDREASEGIKGEVTVVFSPATEISQVSDSEILALVDQFLEDGLSVTRCGDGEFEATFDTEALCL